MTKTQQMGSCLQTTTNIEGHSRNLDKVKGLPNWNIRICLLDLTTDKDSTLRLYMPNSC